MHLLLFLILTKYKIGINILISRMNSTFLIHVAEPRLMKNKTPALRTEFLTNYSKRWAFPGGSVVKNLPAKQERWV